MYNPDSTLKDTAQAAQGSNVNTRCCHFSYVESGQSKFFSTSHLRLISLALAAASSKEHPSTCVGAAAFAPPRHRDMTTILLWKTMLTVSSDLC